MSSEAGINVCASRQGWQGGRATGGQPEPNSTHWQAPSDVLTRLSPIWSLRSLNRDSWNLKAKRGPEAVLSGTPWEQ